MNAEAVELAPSAYRASVATFDWGYRPGRGEATVALNDPDDASGYRSVVVASWEGDEHLVPHVPAAYVDKIFFNLRNDKAAAADLLTRVSRFVGEIDQSDWNTLIAGLAGYEWLMIPGKGGVPLLPGALREEAPGKPGARVRVKMVATDFILGATTHFKPILRGQNPTVAEYGYWALWDWMAFRLLEAQEFDVLARSLNNLSYQLSIYRTYGIPGFNEMGQAPYLAATANQADDSDPS